MSRWIFHASLCMAFSCLLLACQSDTPDAKPAATSAVNPDLGIIDWPSWRGPNQTGKSPATDLPDQLTLNSKTHLWDYPMRGAGSPVAYKDQLYVFGFSGTGQDLQEALLCLNANTGEKLWERRFNDYLSDIIYDRYAIGSPCVDPESGNVYMMTSAGLFVGFDAKGNKLWDISMMESFGRLTFPNGRTGSPVVDGNLVIIRGITAHWGKQGPARDRFYAFNKQTGDLVWSSTPGVRPRDSSFSTPVFAWLKGRRVFYAGTGCGQIVCVDAKTGEPLTRFPFSAGGVNSSVLVLPDHRVIAIHNKENLDSSNIGRMVCVQMGQLPKPGKGPIVLDKSAELWRNPLAMFTSSGVLDGNVVYQITQTGSLVAVDTESGKVNWEKKLSNYQLHASPLLADGKLYTPFLDGKLHVVKPSATGAEVLSTVDFGTKLLGAPIVYNHKLYVQSWRRTYCFAKPAYQHFSAPRTPTIRPRPRVGKPVKLLIEPAEVLITPGDTQTFKIKAVDDKGNVVRQYADHECTIERYIPPTAKVKVKLDASIDRGKLIATKSNTPSAGAIRVTKNGLVGTTRGRILSGLPFKEDFSSYDLTVPHKADGVKFAYPPLPWIGARFKWEVRDLDGNKVLAKTLDRLLFQRAITFIGHVDEKNYTMQADFMTDGNRRVMSTGGLINQRYFVTLKGNWQQIEVSSNHDRIKVAVPFKWKAKSWYTLKSRVDIAQDGSGVIRAKAWPRGGAEPDKWLIEVPHKNAHTHGAPGLIGFSPQGQKRIYVDNIQITPNP